MSILSLSKSVQHAIQAMIYLTMHKANKNKVKIIAKECNIPLHYLFKIIQKLSNHKLINTTTGRFGGIQLSKDPKKIKITDIVFAINGIPQKKELCIIGIDECNDQAHCPIHHSWKKIKNMIYDKFSNQNLESLTKKIIEKRNNK